MVVTAHYHDYIEILYGLQGETEIEIIDAVYRLLPGDMMIVFSEEVHKISSCSSQESVFLEICYDPEILLSSSNSVSDNKFLYAFASTAIVSERLFNQNMLDDTPVPSLLQDLQQEYTSQKYGKDIAVRLLLSQLSLWILRAWKSTEDGRKYSNVNSLDSINTLQKIFNFVDAEYMNKIRMETIANQLNMSYYSFSKFFVTHTGKTFPGYVNEVRLTKSKILLTTTGKSITEIALEVGFISTSHYIQRFKESNQMTPQQFRKEFIQ